MASQASAVKVPSWPTRLRQMFANEKAVAYLFLLPSLIGFVTFYAVPAVRGLFISFTDWNMLSDPTFVGLENYQELVVDDDFWDALLVTLSYVLWNIPIQTLLAVLIAVMMDRLTRSIIVRGIILLPWLMPNVVVGLLWLWMLDPRLGIVNVGLETLGLDSIPFLGNPDYAIASIAGINVWRHVGYTALLVFAGLQTIPKSIYEAASIDGANDWQTFWGITLPMLRPVLAFVLVTSVIGSFQIFDTIAITTQGGPINATEVINWLIFEQAFERFNMGYATTVSVALFLILVVVSIIQMRLLRADETD
ncbi:MAG: sugar ABC transporter permease [Ardenticatenaceae bacterium]|nr:sugar ABC transporter permease [Ardenticatenaceae bacterium]